MRGRTFVVLAALAVFLLTGCGGDDTNKQDEKPELNQNQSVEAADEIDLKDFPKANGRATLTQLIGKVAGDRDLNMAPGGTELIQGERTRLPFGLFTDERKPVWGPTVVYIAKDAKSPAIGPFPAPAISLDVPEEYRSETSKADYGKAGNGIYVTKIKGLKGVDQQQVMTLTNLNGRYHASLQALGFQKDATTPKVGDKAPPIDNQTIEDVGEDNIEKLDTRVPPDDMHRVSVKDAMKNGKPVVLIFATPKHCTSRVCGPVVDVGAYLDGKYADQAAFVHVEIYNDNDVSAGFKPEVGKYGLPTEPYTFVIGKDGRVIAKFEGPVTIPELEAVVIKATR